MGGAGFLLIIIAFGFLYFVLVRPQKRRQLAQQRMLNELHVGDEIVPALAASILLAVPGSPVYRKPVLGLDLQGGLEVVLRAVPPKGHKLTPADLDRSVSIMQSRINGLGVSEPEIRKQGANQIV